ncbi:gamma-glutamyl-gamma-aminobutyrate hydrolase family protein [Psychrobacter sp.]|uniref:gamma-glutamyl-gamma-aminobutyrate hydrolase family protein n=1 Tax=Psychrobacter sp. TaxID=56811 RepID=UPI0025E95B7B|nr:gamma-glutamyl-gamma-aminobutyrate hydrolase family protein [Psychrobacter sp.]
MQNNRPNIAIVSCHKLIDGQPSQAVYQKYIDAINYYGGNPIILPNVSAESENFNALIDLIDGIVLTGSYSNVAPSRYGATHLEQLQDLGRDELSFKLLAHADKSGTPLLAICRGLQEMNVYFGGTLHPDWREVGSYFEPHLEDKSQPLDVQYQTVHDVNIQSEGRLSEFGTKWHVNSLHKQAIRDVGNRLFVEALAPDGLVEAISAIDHPFLIGVQWHPELNYINDNLSKFLFTEFIHHASKKDD